MFPSDQLTAARSQRSALAVLVGRLDPDSIMPGEAEPLWEAFDAMVRLATSARTLVARKVEESASWKRSGSRSAAEHLARKAGTSTGAARSELETSKRLQALPGTESALRRGELSGPQAAAVADGAAANPGAEHTLLRKAKTASLAELRDESAKAKAAADPDPDARWRRLHAERRLRRFVDGEGAWNPTARGTVDAGSHFNAALDPIIDELFTAARRQGRREPREAYAFDALIELALRRTAGEGDAAGRGDAAPFAGGQGASSNGHGEAGGRAGYGESGNGAGAAHAGGVGRHGEAGEDRAGNGHGEGGGAGRHGDGGNGAAARHGGGVDGRTSAGQGGDEGHYGESGGGDGVGWSGEGSDSPGGEQAGAGRDQDDADHTGGGRDGGLSAGAGSGGGERPGSPARRAGASRRSPTHLALLRLDIEALRRGRVEGDELCEITGLGPIPVRVARQFLGDAVLKLIITRGVDVAHVTHLGRGPSAAQRAALLWSSPTCIVQGCSAVRVEVDHRIPYAQTHHTRLDESDPMCGQHHGLKTYKGWALVAGSGRRPMVAPDDPRHPANAPPAQGPPGGAPPGADGCTSPAVGPPGGSGRAPPPGAGTSPAPTLFGS